MFNKLCSKLWLLICIKTWLKQCDIYTQNMRVQTCDGFIPFLLQHRKEWLIIKGFILTVMDCDSDIWPGNDSGHLNTAGHGWPDCISVLAESSRWSIFCWFDLWTDRMFESAPWSIFLIYRSNMRSGIKSEKYAKENLSKSCHKICNLRTTFPKLAQESFLTFCFHFDA